MKKLYIFICAGLLAFVMTTCQKSYDQKFRNPNLPVDERVDDLVSRMTLEEKISQMVHEADSIPRLGVPIYNWWNECLHGVARAGIATVFPQAIAFGATFNEQLIYNMASIISDEARAKHHEFVRNGERGISQGLTFWSPNINIFRDPRWGRGQETYGEDPYLTSRIGVQFVKGLQGSHDKYLKLVATPKHLAVHSGPEPERHHFNAITNETDLWETYLPAFEATVKEAKAYSVMSAYNRYLGESCTASELLLQQILRDKWGFDGYVVSDCGAVNDIFLNHKIVKTGPEAAALAVRKGCDLNCGSAYDYLMEAVQKELISEAEIDKAVKRLFKARFLLGMFDPQEDVPYAHIPFEVNDSKEHNKFALKVAQQSMVLLKNDKGLLPLDKNMGTIAVIGPNAKSLDVLLGNYNGTPSSPVTALQGIKNKVGEKTEILYHTGCNLAGDEPPLSILTDEYLSYEGEEGLMAEYFDNVDLEGKPVAKRIEKEINSNWERGNVSKKIGNTNYSIRFTGTLKVDRSGEYALGLTGDDGYRLFIDDELLIENWSKHPPETKITRKMLNKDKEYDIKVEFYQGTGGAEISMGYAYIGDDPFGEVKKIAHKSDVVLFFGGLSPRLEGEEMDVDYEGFKGGDRTNIKLPKAQQDILKMLHQTGKPVVLVLMNGSALAINWADENIPAILEAWYPGQRGGDAIANILFGDYNPAGRLPVTFYKSVDDLPPFRDYNMKNRTYRYYKGDVLYPFGYGLSYTSFSYGEPKISENKINTDEKMILTVEVINAGDRGGEEVVQLYIKDLMSDITYRPIKSLKGFKRVYLNKGQSTDVKFEITPEMLKLYDPGKDDYVVEPGEFMIMVGGSSADLKSVKLTVN